MLKNVDVNEQPFAMTIVIYKFGMFTVGSAAPYWPLKRQKKTKKTLQL